MVCCEASAQMPQCTSPTMNHFVTELCTYFVHISVKNGALCDICLMHFGICEMSWTFANIDTAILPCVDAFFQTEMF